MSKFLYPIYKLNIESYKKWWLYHKKAGGSGILSEILQGFSFNLENTLNRKFNLFEIEGNSVQDGTPSPDNEVPILSSGDNGSINEKIQTRNLVDGVLDNSSSTTAKLITKDMNVLVPAGTYTISFTNKPVQSNGNIYSGSTNILNIPWYSDKKTFTLTEPTLITRITCDVGANQIVYAQLEQGSTATPYVEHQEQDYSIFVQQPMRSIGDVRDCFVKVDGNWYERHYIKYLDLAISAMNNSENYPGWKNVQQIKNDFPNINTQLITKTSFLCNIFEKTSRIMIINTIGNNSILYLDKSLLNITQTQWKENYPDLILKLAYISPLPIDLPCTSEQIDVLENKPSTYKDFTIIQSEDETPAYLKIQYWKEVQS